SGSAVGKEVAAVAKEFADKLYEMARKLREESPSTSMKRWVEEVEHKVGEVTGLLKKHAELKVGEAGDNHPHEGDEKKGLHSLYHQQADTEAGQRWLGNEPSCTPYCPHSVLYSLPEAAIDAWRYGFCLKFRKRGQLKDSRKKE
ncbi:hypothetical protein Tco_1088796, partial [Tanacetum coccineum]